MLQVESWLFKIPTDLTRIYLSFISTTTSHDLGKLAETCWSMTRYFRNAICCRCGCFFSRGQSKEMVDVGDSKLKQAHASSYQHKSLENCIWPLELDPFREIYALLPFERAFISGGFATFLHFQEYRRYYRSWLLHKEANSHDLDVFFYNVDANDYTKTARGFQIQSTKTLTAKMSDGYEGSGFMPGRDIDDDADCNLNRTVQVQLTSWCNRRYKLGEEMTVDLIGCYERSHMSPVEIMDKFDLNCCKVGYTYKDKQITWILHPEHSNLESYITNPKANAANKSSSVQNVQICTVCNLMFPLQQTDVSCCRCDGILSPSQFDTCRGQLQHIITIPPMMQLIPPKSPIIYTERQLKEIRRRHKYRQRGYLDSGSRQRQCLCTRYAIAPSYRPSDIIIDADGDCAVYEA